MRTDLISPYESVELAIKQLNSRLSSSSTIDPDALRRLQSLLISQGMLPRGRYRSFLSPLVLPGSLYNSIAKAAESLALAFERICEAALKDESVMTELGVQSREKSLAEIDPGYSCLCIDSRFDMLLTKTGFSFLEFNAESPSMLTNQKLVEDIIVDLQHVKAFLQLYSCRRPQPHQQLLSALIESYHEWGGNKEFPQIAIVDWKEVARDVEFKVLKEYFEFEGYPTLICDPDDLRYEKQALTSNGKPVDIVYKRVLINEFLQKFNENHPLVRAYAERKVFVASSFRSKLIDKKASFAILSDPRYEYLFTDEQLTFARRHIPWTRRIRPQQVQFCNTEWDLLDLIRHERDSFVIKPNDAYHSSGVLIGRQTDPALWEQAVRLALKTPYVVQEFVSAEAIPMPTFREKLEWEEIIAEFDPFLFRNKVGGALVKLLPASSPTDIAGVTALFVMDS